MQYIENQNDLIVKALSFMAEQGLPCDDQLIFDSKIRRYSSDVKRNQKDEWYVSFQGFTSKNKPYLYVIFGSWSTGIKFEYNSLKDGAIAYDSLEFEEIKKIIEERKQQADEEIKIQHGQVALQAKEQWNKYFTKAPSEEYLKYVKSKGINPIGDVRFGLKDDKYPSLVIPVKNFSGEIRSLQYISVDDTGKNYKRFLSGGEKQGNFFVLGELQNTDMCYVVEGYATGISVYEAVNKPVVVVFDAYNIEPVISNLRQYYKNLDIVIAADADQVGTQKAQEAADKFCCKVVVPKILNGTSKQNDFNDLMQISGIDEVKKQLTQNIFGYKSQGELSDNILNKHEPCSDFKISHLPPVLQDYILALSKTTSAHPIMLTSSVLTMLSAFIGTKVHMPSGVYFQDLYLNLWILCIAGSGQYKTTALNKGAKIAMDKQYQVFKSLKAMQCESPSEELKEQILKKSLEGIILPTKLTSEAFLEHLGQGHQGVVYASEFGGWLQNLDKNHNNDFKAILTEFYDVPASYRSKTKTQGDYIIEKPYVSICGVSALPWIRANLKSSDISSGFFARFLLFVPPSQEGRTLAFPEPVEEAYIKAEQQFKSAIDNILHNIGEDRLMYPTNEARILIQQYQDYIDNLPKQYGDKAKLILDPYLKRWVPYLIKLSMLMQLLFDSSTNQISDIAVMSAMKILMPAMESTAKLFDGELGESEFQYKCRIILEFICKKIQGNKITS